MEIVDDETWDAHDRKAITEGAKRAKPTVPEVAPLVRALYEVHPAGCCLHIVLDDGNVQDSNVQFCLDLAVERGHASCAALAVLLGGMSKTQRTKLARGKRA
jgi:hypothetical protein